MWRQLIEHSWPPLYHALHLWPSYPASCLQKPVSAAVKARQVLLPMTFALPLAAAAAHHQPPQRQCVCPALQLEPVLEPAVDDQPQQNCLQCDAEQELDLMLLLLLEMALVIGYATWRWWCSAGLDAAATESELEWQAMLSLHQIVAVEMASRLQKQQVQRKAAAGLAEWQQAH